MMRMIFFHIYNVIFHRMFYFFNGSFYQNQNKFIIQVYSYIMLQDILFILQPHIFLYLFILLNIYIDPGPHRFKKKSYQVNKFNPNNFLFGEMTRINNCTLYFIMELTFRYLFLKNKLIVNCIYNICIMNIWKPHLWSRDN